MKIGRNSVEIPILILLGRGPSDTLWWAWNWRWVGDERWNFFTRHQHRKSFGVHCHLGRGEAKLGIEARAQVLKARRRPGLEVIPLAADVAVGGGGRVLGGGGSRPEEALEDSHDKEHGDEDGGGDKPERHRIDGAVEAAPALLLVGVVGSSALRRVSAAG